MVRPIAALFMGAAMGATTFAGEVDFTPHEAFYLAETTKVPCVAFRNGSQDMLYSPPANWTLTGGGRKLTLMAKQISQAGATMLVESVAEPVPATQASVQAYSELALRYVPRGATKITVVQAGVSEMGICKHSMIEVTLNYAMFGQACTMNILFMPFEQQQLLSFQVSARATDFPAVGKAFRASLFSLQGLDPQPTGPTAAAGAVAHKQ